VASRLEFAIVFSVLLCVIHSRGPLRAFPKVSRCESGEVLNVTEHFMYLLNYRNCFWVLTHDGMTFRYQRRQFLCPIYAGTGTSAILEMSLHCIRCFCLYTRVHCLFRCFAPHCAHPRPGGKLHPLHLCQTGVGRELTMQSEICKNHSVHYTSRPHH
jgi:hypothetical protein